MKHGRIIIPVLLSFSLVLSVATMSARDFATKAESNDIDIQGIVGQYTMTEDDFTPELYSINLATASMVDSEIESNEEANFESSTDGVTNVDTRNWYDYSSSTPSQNMTSAEQEFYNRLTALSQYYMDNSTIDAYFVDAYNTYAINGVKYSDLGLTSKEAFYVAEWFLYNNPQYYFLKPTFLTTSYAIYLGCHDIAADGDDRAELTNLIFDDIDYMVDYIGMYATTPLETEQYIHDIVCGNLDYVSGQYDQSIYSAIVECQTVCAGYSGMMNVLLNKSGIDAITVLSSCHAWNEVCLDGNYYGVDATWDDSLGNHTYFNVSDANLKRYDSIDREHTYDSHFSNWVPTLSEYDYSVGDKYEEPTPQEIVVDAPELSTETVDDTTGRVRWTAVTGATAYEIGIYSDSEYSDLQVCRQTKNYSVKLSNMNYGQTYYFTLRAVMNVDGVDYFSDYVYGSYTCPIPESAPADNDDNNEPSETEDNTAGTNDNNMNSTSGTKPNPSEPTTPDEPSQEPEKPEITVNAPYDLTVTAQTETSAKIMWSPIDGATKYNVRIYRDEALTQLMAQANTLKLSMKLSGMTPGNTVYAQVCAIAEVDGEEYYSDYVTIPVTALVSQEPEQPADTPSENPSSGDVNPPADNPADVPSETPGTKDEPVTPPVEETKPIELTVPEVTISDLTTNSAKIIWSTVDDATSYEFQICNDANYSSVIAKKTTTKHKMSLSGLAEGGTYYVQVRALATIDGQDYVSDWSRCDFTTISSVITVDTPSNIVCTYVSDTASKLSWGVVSDTATYEVIIYNDENHTSKLGSISTAKKSLKISGLVSGRTYYVAIRAIENIDGENYYSEWTNVHLNK